MYILIITIMVMGSKASPAVQEIDFTTKENCVAAFEQLDQTNKFIEKNKLVGIVPQAYPTLTCVKK